MKEVILKSDLEKIFREEKQYIDSLYVCSELYRGGMLDELERLKNYILYYFHSNFSNSGN